MIVDLHLLLFDDGGRLLLGSRRNTGFADGCWHLPAGHHEEGESFVDGAVREAEEELGVTIDPGELELVHLMEQPGRTALFFAVRRWNGQVENCEPEKCAALEWFDWDELPRPIVGYCRAALEAIRSGQLHSTYGWELS